MDDKVVVEAGKFGKFRSSYGGRVIAIGVVVGRSVVVLVDKVVVVVEAVGAVWTL